MIHKEPIHIGPECLNSSISSRTLLFLDTNIWIDLAEQNTEDSRKCLSQLREAVASGRLLCPLAWPLILELYKQSHDSALRVAKIMDDLSLSTTFISDNEVLMLEVEFFIKSILTGKLVSIPRRALLVPFVSYLSTYSQIEFPESWTVENREKFISLFTEQMKVLTITDFINMAKVHLPRPERKIPPPFSQAYQRRAEYTKGDKKKAWLVEAHSIMTSMVIPKLNVIRSKLPIQSQLVVLAAINCLPQDGFMSSIIALFERMPSQFVRTEILTLSGLDTNRKDSMNDFYDLEMMVVPFAYSDAFASQDRWLRHIAKATPVVMKQWPARFLSGLREITCFLRNAL